MGCGCTKSKASVAQGTSGLVAAASAPAVFTVENESGELVATYTNPVTARAEARRIGGVVKTPTSSAVAAGN